MIETWRWFGPDDSITLNKIKQAGATGIVSSLHDVPTGELWQKEKILEQKKFIEDAGLSWDVIESIPVHNDIKTRTRNYKSLIKNYQDSIRNAAECGIKTICYNFMPVVDWTRTNLTYKLPDSSRALRFEMTDFAAYDIYILKREGAVHSYTEEVVAKAGKAYQGMNDEAKLLLEKNIIAGLPGGEGSYTRESIRIAIEEFIQLGTDGFRANLFAFLEEIIPVADEVGARMCIHPDDPPFSLFGLPRVVSTAEDARALLGAQPSPANGLTMCAGSYGARGDNDLVSMVKEFGSRVYFVHLRNVIREADGSFYESEHLSGDNDMVGLISALLDEESKREADTPESDRVLIPMRPDHGHLLDDDLDDESLKPGYGYTGRLKGLAELRGVIHALNTIRAKA